MRVTRAAVVGLAWLGFQLGLAGRASAQDVLGAGGVQRTGPVTCREFLHAPGLPFSATRMETRVQTLANGSTVTTRSRTTMARDSGGRVYMATEFLEAPRADAEESTAKEDAKPKVLLMQLTDPTAEAVFTWSTGQGSTTVRVMHVRGMGEEIRGAPDSTPVPLLDRKMVGGVFAVGYHLTGHLAVGKEGNDQALVWTEEWWCSPELRLNVSEVMDDPRWGRRTIELTEIERAEPDPALFRLPDGYKVRQVTIGDED